MVRFLQFLACMMLLSLVVGCQPPEEVVEENPTQTNPNKKLRIAVIPKGTTHEFWKSVHYGANEAAKELDVEIEWLGPQLENDREGQITVVQNFVTQKIDGICLAPLDSQALLGPVEEAVAAGVPVVIFDSGLDDHSQVVSYVATDNFRGGELAGDEMARILDGKGKVIMLRYTQGSESTTQREEGFLEALKKHEGIEILSSNQYAGTTPESSLDKASQLIATYKGQFDGVFGVCEPNAAGILQALENEELAGKVKFIGFDPNPRMVEALGEGKMHGIVLQDPVTMGYEAVKTIVAKIRGEEVAERTPTGEYVATPDNMQTEEMKKLLEPPQFGE